ncbi:hypothetical protein DYB36_000389 [Aphanomyces astaci]|uniref:Uncharacterized protein n=1 Tax=Aphanomyces astaci TaxID=112090 RepID=A0A397AMK6_APHAT|nr:hypothetical protein DYB36_000389 [Aphanomyces astaci]
MPCYVGRRIEFEQHWCTPIALRVFQSETTKELSKHVVLFYIALAKVAKVELQRIVALHHLSVLYKASGDMEGYHRHARMALLTNKATHEHANELGLSLLAQGKLDQAFDQFRAAIAAAPTYGPSHLNMSVVQAKRGNLRESLAHCEDALKFMPGDASVLRNLGKLHEAMGRTQASLAYNKRAAVAAPRDADLARKIALQNVASGDIPRAHDAYAAHRRILGKKVDVKI